MVYTIQEIQDIIRPLAEQYGLKRVYLFGSYARWEADEESDIDLVFEPGDQVLSWLGGDLIEVIASRFTCPVDCLPLSFLEGGRSPIQRLVEENFRKDRIILYETESFGERPATPA